MKLCIECNHYRKICLMSEDAHACLAESDKHISPVTGKVSMTTMLEKCDAEEMREVGEPCGPEAKLWTPKLPPPPKSHWWSFLIR